MKSLGGVPGLFMASWNTKMNAQLQFTMKSKGNRFGERERERANGRAYLSATAESTGASGCGGGSLTEQ